MFFQCYAPRPWKKTPLGGISDGGPAEGGTFLAFKAGTTYGPCHMGTSVAHI